MFLQKLVLHLMNCFHSDQLTGLYLDLKNYWTHLSACVSHFDAAGSDSQASIVLGHKSFCRNCQHFHGAQDDDPPQQESCFLQSTKQNALVISYTVGNYGQFYLYYGLGYEFKWKSRIIESKSFPPLLCGWKTQTHNPTTENISPPHHPIMTKKNYSILATGNISMKFSPQQIKQTPIFIQYFHIVHATLVHITDQQPTWSSSYNPNSKVVYFSLSPRAVSYLQAK